jgi:2-polyprenyl-6-methoxyphenol hydroxylase-like FAD-dependent oxidoreductase
MLGFLDQLQETVVETDVCIVGAGPAGITLALSLADRGHAVTLLEAGGLAPPGPEELDPYKGSVTGRDYPLQGSRLRYFGGTTGHWGGWSRPLDAVDLAAKPHIPFTGWPLSRAELDPWYDEAHEWLEIAANDYFENSEPPFNARLLPARHGLTTRYFRFSPPTRYGSAYRDQVAKHQGVHCLLGANATSLSWRAEGEISAITARSLAGRQLEVRSRVAVLAMGGIENARFLLNTEEQASPAVGNHSDWLGRGFMDHPGWSPGVVVSRDNLAYQQFTHEGERVMPVLGIAEDTLMSEPVLNCCGMFHPVSFDDGVEKAYFDNVWTGGLGTIGEVTSYRLQLIFEPSPCRDSRLSLTDQRDALGLRRVNLHWAFNDYDFEMLDRSIGMINAYFGQTGLGRLRLSRPVTPENIARPIRTGLHHMGTTRMSEDPGEGVVDQHGKVHGVENLFVAGSSVFPAVGFSNPTLTIVALTCRMAGHIHANLSGS